MDSNTPVHVTMNIGLQQTHTVDCTCSAEPPNPSALRLVASLGLYKFRPARTYYT